MVIKVGFILQPKKGLWENKIFSTVKFPRFVFLNSIAINLTEITLNKSCVTITGVWRYKKKYKYLLTVL